MRTPGVLSTLALGVLTATMAAAAALAGPEADLPDNEAGRCAYAYLEAFNSGDDATLKGFFAACLAPGFQPPRPVEQRLAVARQIRDETGRLELRRVVESTPAKLVLLVRTERGGWAELSFAVDSATGTLAGIRFEEADDPERSGTPPATWAELPATLEGYLDRLGPDGFSGVVLVARGDTVVVHTARGLADRAFAVPVRPDTRFNLGSINKLFTRVAIAQLHERGLLSLGARLAEVLPDYPNRAVADAVTVQQLAEFSSGMGDFFGERFDATPKDRLRDNRDYLPLFADDALLFAPGSSRRYSNAGYVVLGLVVEKVAGQSYYDYVRERVLLPAGMKDTDSFEADVPVTNLAEGYTASRGSGEHPGEPLRSNVYTRPARGSAAGGGYSTAPDLLRFARALRTGTLLGPAGTAWILGGPAPGGPAPNPPGPAGNGFGFAGGAPGINAMLEMEGDVTVVVLANLDPPAAQNVARTVTRWTRRLPAMP